MRSAHRFAAVSLLALAVAGCSSRDNSADAPPTGGGGAGGGTGVVTPPAPVAFQTRFGTAFAAFFNASPTSDPRDPTASDVPPLSPTTDPLDN